MNLQFTFLCAGIPQPEYRWVKDGEYLGDFTTDHFYKIQHAKRSDAGDYQCIARNDAGAIHSEKIRVTVACKLEFINLIISIIPNFSVACENFVQNIHSCAVLSRTKNIDERETLLLENLISFQAKNLVS
jgi:hypothetical protein